MIEVAVPHLQKYLMQPVGIIQDPAKYLNQFVFIVSEPNGDLSSLGARNNGILTIDFINTLSMRSDKVLNNY